MRQCVFLGDREDQCAEEWRLMDTGERFFYSDAGRRAQAKFEQKRRQEEERAKAECEAQGRKDASCEIEQFLRQRRKSIEADIPPFIRSPRRPGRAATSARRDRAVRAVCALMTSSNLVDCTTGRSAGLAPLRNAAHIDAGLTMRVCQACRVADQPANFGI